MCVLLISHVLVNVDRNVSLDLVEGSKVAFNVLIEDPPDSCNTECEDCLKGQFSDESCILEGGAYVFDLKCTTPFLGVIVKSRFYNATSFNEPTLEAFDLSTGSKGSGKGGGFYALSHLEICFYIGSDYRDTCNIISSGRMLFTDSRSLRGTP